MSKRKGLSTDEKRTKMLEIFHESKDVFQLKDLERLAPRAKAITAQSVKDIVQGLVDDGLVDSAKIGTMVYFWSFPSKARMKLKQQIDELEKKNSDAAKKLKTLEEWAANERSKDCDRDACSELARNISSLKRREEQLKKDLLGYADNDPHTIQQKVDGTKQVHDAANRWTDNIFYVKTWCKRKFAVEEKDLNRNFEIPEDLDYLEDG